MPIMAISNPSYLPVAIFVNVEFIKVAYQLTTVVFFLLIHRWFIGDVVKQVFDAGIFKQLRHADLFAEQLAHKVGELYNADGISTGIEEIIGDAYFFFLQHLLPDGDELLFHFIAW